MEASKTTKFADRETLSGLMVHFSQVIGQMANFMVLDLLQTRMGKQMKDSGISINS